MTATFASSVSEIGGCRVTLRRGGAGPKLLYLHGANGAAVVQPFLHELARDYEVLVPEHPGFGGSDEPAWLDNIHDLAYFYLDFLEQLDIRDAVVIGSSIGGWLALEIAVRNTSRIRALSLIGPAGIHVPGLKKGDMFLWSPEEKVRNLFADQGIAERLLAQPVSPAGAGGRDEKPVHRRAARVGAAAARPAPVQVAAPHQAADPDTLGRQRQDPAGGLRCRIQEAHSARPRRHRAELRASAPGREAAGVSAAVP